jgi:aspartyl/glutamyl-tRNA(Asn/Gln) amidotransferase C subunit
MEIDISNLAKLARIAVTPAESRKLNTDLKSILGYISELESVQVKTEDENALAADALRNVMREDTDAYERGAFTKEILDEAPATEKGYLVVKQILGK